MQPLKEAELRLVDKLKENLSDLPLEPDHLEPKNLVRFVRAREHNLQNAEKMFRNHIVWREKFQMDNILEWKFPLEYKLFWPAYVSGFDRWGNPVLVMEMGHWKASMVGQVGYNEFQRYCFRLIETSWSLIRKQSIGQKEMKQLCIIVDVKDLSWRTVTTYDAVHGVVELFKCADAFYPETLRVCYVVNAPAAVGVVWRLVQPFLSEHTKSKIKFLPGSDPSGWKDEMCQGIREDQLPQQYGGRLSADTKIEI